MRLFISVEVSGEVKSHVYEMQKKMNTGLAKIGWVHKKNLHLTLKFLGEVEGGKVEGIKSRLSKVSFKPFKLKLAKLGFFPSEDCIKVIWVGIDPEDKMIGLQQKVDAELLDMFPGEQKFTSHLTLGRVKSIKKKKEFKKILESVEVKPLEFEVKNFKLMKSELKRGGAEYEELAVF